MFFNSSTPKETPEDNDNIEQTDSGPTPDLVGHNTSSVKDKKQLEIELLMRQQEQLKNLEKLGMMQQQEKAKSNTAQEEAPPVKNETVDDVRNEESLPEDNRPIHRPTRGKSLVDDVFKQICLYCLLLTYMIYICRY